MRIEYIQSFQIDKNVTFTGAMVAIEGTKAFMIQKCGYILLTDITVINVLQCKTVPEYLYRILKSRKFLIGSNIKESKEKEIEVRPEFFMIDMTNKCNLRCNYCLRNLEQEENCISTEKLRDIGKFITTYCDEYKIANISVQAWGGEPLLEKNKIIALTKFITPQKTKVHYSIETNATLLTNDVIEELYKNHIGIGISIDGDRKCHDLQRTFVSGKGSYDTVKKNLLQAQRYYKNKIGTITTITKQTAVHIEKIIEHLVLDLHISNIKLNFVHASTYTHGQNQCLNTQEIADTELRILYKIIELQERGYDVMKHNIFIKLKNLLFREYADICLSCGCCGGKKMIVFDMDGNIYPCELTDDASFVIGSIYKKESLIEQIKMTIDKDKAFFKMKKAVECEKCYWKFFCRGGCTVRALSEKRQMEVIDIDHIECAINQVLYPALMELVLRKPHIVNQMLGEDLLVDE